jgi:dTMP kinase
MIGGPVARAGSLVVVEGIEGSGKSTLVANLAERLTAYGCDVVTLRDPGGTALGDEIRALLLTSTHTPAPATEALLFMASRAELVTQHVAPALADGRIVLLDRFLLSTLAYQVAGRGLNEYAVLAANTLALGRVTTAVTFVLDLPFEEGMRRATRRGALDRIEREGEAFHRRVAAQFTAALEPSWQNIHPECGQVVRLDGMATPEELVEEAWQILSVYEVIPYRPVAP